MSILIGWTTVGPKLFPNFFPKPKPRQQVAEKADAPDVGKPVDEKQDAPAEEGDSGTDKTSDATDSASSESDTEPPAEDTGGAPLAEAGDMQEPAEIEQAAKLPEHPDKIVLLGSMEAATGYCLQAELTTRGAAISGLVLNDARYRVLKNRKEALSVVHVALTEDNTELRTLATTVPAIDAQLAKFGTDLTRLNWEIVETVNDPDVKGIVSGVTFRILSPDGTLAVLKRYRLKRITDGDITKLAVRDADPAGYQLLFDLIVQNRGQEEHVVQYGLQGPVGLPLENEENTRKFRDIKVGFREGGGAVDAQTVTAGQVADEVEELKPAPRTFQYVGVDVQYFTSLLLPQDETAADERGYLVAATPMLVQKHGEKQQSDISVQLQSYDVPLAAGKELTHSYILFAGPKRPKLLEPLGADAMQDFGWFGVVAKAMLAVLKFFHDWGAPYGLAIILLTVMVRGCMYPISKKQAVGAKKMKELQPQLAELKKKHGKDKEKFARAQMELFSKANYNPLSGCLPIFLQLPIFIGLYQGLNNSVDLRMAPFLYIDNLAAPDALFRLPFRLPFLGGDFNLLPILTIVLFIAQQKMFMPPPTDEQSAMQQKMMNYMMVFMGFLFYRMPAGLCVYFIASSLWGMAERKLLDFGSNKTAPPPDKTPPGPAKKAPAKKAGGDNLFGRLARQLDKAAQIQQETRDKRGGNKSIPDDRPGSKRKGKSRPRR